MGREASLFNSRRRPSLEVTVKEAGAAVSVVLEAHDPVRVAEVVIPSPEQAAGEGGQRGIDAHQLQALQLSLGGQQPIERVAMELRVATGADAVMQLDGERLKPLLLQQGSQIIKQRFGAGSLPSRTLAAISQPDAALTKIFAAGSSMAYAASRMSMR
jgi:hypothetical protein